MKGVMLNNMLILATHKHAGQMDKSGEPYILHSLAVMYLLRTHDEELQCIALGHDLIEDTGTTMWDLERQGFSSRVMNGIYALTRPQGMTYTEYKERVKSNPDAIRVKLCDLEHNMDPTRKYVLPRTLLARYQNFFYELHKIANKETTSGQNL